MKQKIRLTRGQEREERRALGKGMRTSVIGAVLCWLPLVGLLLSSIGFVQVNRRITNAHRKRQRVYVIVSLLILILCTGVLVTEAYVYTHDPYLVNDMKEWVLDKITGGSYYGGYYYYDSTYQEYSEQYYYNEDAYTYSEDYEGGEPETEGQSD